MLLLFRCWVMSNSLVTPWTVAYQAPLWMEFSRQEYWSGLPIPFPGHLPGPGIKPEFPSLLVYPLPLSHQGSPVYIYTHTHTRVCVCVYDLLWEIGSYDDGGWEVPQSAFWKLRRGSWYKFQSKCKRPISQLKNRTNSFLFHLLFCSGFKQIGWDPLTLGRAIWFAQPLRIMLFYITFIQKYPCRPTQNNV